MHIGGGPLVVIGRRRGGGAGAGPTITATKRSYDNDAQREGGVAPPPLITSFSYDRSNDRNGAAGGPSGQVFVVFVDNAVSEFAR